MKILLIPFLVMIFFAPMSFSQISIGVTGGFDVVSVKQNFEKESLEEDIQQRLSYHAGIVVNYSMWENILLQSGIFYKEKGYKLHRDLIFGIVDRTGWDEKIIYNYLEVPILGVYQLGACQFSIGPYIALGIGGKTKWKYTEVNNNEYQEFSDMVKLEPTLELKDFTLEDKYFYMMDYGLNAGIGYRWNEFVVDIYYSYGIANMQAKRKAYPDYRNDFAYYNRVFAFSVSYFLNTKK